MKYIIVWLLGLATGAIIFAAGISYNPFISAQGLSPLAVTDSQTIALSYSGVATDNLIYTNDGESTIQPYPEKVLQLWEAPIRKTSAMATVLRDGRNQAVGYGIKIASWSEKTKLIEGQAIVDSVWYVYLPGRGGIFIDQYENHWDFLRNVVIPAYRSSGKVWKGSWLGNITAGPGSLATAKVTGVSGEFDGLDMLGVETLSVKAWRVDGGAAAADGQLLLELPAVIEPEEDVTATSDQ